VLLEEFLNAKPLYYNEIDYSRMPRIYESVKEHLKLPKLIHLVGTNGKGTTGRFLASALRKGGFSVGHYSSPHILSFNERIWLDGESVSMSILEEAHKKLLGLLDQKDASSLSYFEYTTLLAVVVYERCDYVVFEAGLGGEYDATAVFENILTLVTPIGKDHEAFLGTTIKAIATTKLNAMQQGVILAQQQHEEVYEIAQSIAQKKSAFYFQADALLDEPDSKKIVSITSQLNLADYLQQNLTLAIAALKYLKVPYEVEFFENSVLFGRLTPLSPNILLDVGHNVLAAQQIVKSLFGKKYTLIYNSFKDKEYTQILSLLEPIIESVELIAVEDARIESREKIEAALDTLGLVHKKFTTLQEGKNYLVFGSFSVAEAFLKVYNG